MATTAERRAAQKTDTRAAQRKARNDASIAHVPGQSKRARKGIHAGEYVHDEAFNEEAHDLGPWIETPKSSRVSAFRYDYLNNAVQVTWRNGGKPYIYLEVPYEGFRSFARVASKGRHINSALEHFGGFRDMTPQEADAPSNAERKSLTSRVRV
jgi:KTSC domain